MPIKWWMSYDQQKWELLSKVSSKMMKMPGISDWMLTIWNFLKRQLRKLFNGSKSRSQRYASKMKRRTRSRRWWRSCKKQLILRRSSRNLLIVQHSCLRRPKVYQYKTRICSRRLRKKNNSFLRLKMQKKYYKTNWKEVRWMYSLNKKKSGTWSKTMKIWSLNCWGSSKLTKNWSLR